MGYKKEKGLSLIEVAVVLIFSCLVLIMGTKYFRSRHFESSNLTTYEHFTELSMALSTYIKFNEQEIKNKFVSDGGKPWQLDESNLYAFLIPEASDIQKKKFQDGYGNQIHIIIGLYSGQIFGLLVDNGIKQSVSVDYLNKLKILIGKSAGAVNTKQNILDGIADSWTFPLSYWSVPGIDLQESALLSLVFDKTFSQTAVNALQVSKSEAGVVTDVTDITKTINWQPVYSEDSLSISYDKSNDTDYIEYSLSDAEGVFFKSDSYANAFLISPQSSWIIKGDTIEIVLKAHDKYNDTLSIISRMKVSVSKKNAVNYFEQAFSDVSFNYEYAGLKMNDDNKFILSGCSGERDILWAKIKSVTLTPTQKKSGNLLIPMNFKLTFSNAFAKDVPLFVYSVSSTTDAYFAAGDDYTDAVDLASGKCSENSSAYRSSEINLYLIDFYGNEDKPVSSKNVGWNISGKTASSINWRK